jgi:hypothetical protein
MAIIGICTWKTECKDCKIVDRKDRPNVCRDIKCHHLTICTSCGLNKYSEDTSDPDKTLCNECYANQNPTKKVRVTSQQQKTTSNAVDSMTVMIPGEAPPSLSEKEKDYYIKRWTEYDGYFRDPAAYAVVHHMILEELNLNYIQSKIISIRGGVTSDELTKQKENSIKSLESLKKQLPEKEAREDSDEEKALCNAYSKYLEEIGKSTKRGFRRVLTEEAIALAPELYFKIDPRELLERCGFDVATLDEVLEKFYVPEEIGTTAEEILEFLGFKLKEEYALPFAKKEKDKE